MPTPPPSPSKTALNVARHVFDAMQRAGDLESQPGMVMLVGNGDEHDIRPLGRRDVASGAPMERDTIFRIASMTKPIAAATAMLLVEDGAIGLDQPLDQWLPELAERRVLRAVDAALTDTVAAQRPITLRDLMTLRMGFGAIMAASSRYPIQIAMNELEVGPSFDPISHPPDEFMKRLGSLPLVHQPGQVWMYDTGFDVLGVLLARVSGMSLKRLMSKRIFAPLGMGDTSFATPNAKLDRLATCYRSDPETGASVIWDPARGGKWASPPPFESAAGGLVSTAADFHTFAAMMLRGGKHKGEIVLSPESIAAMTADQIPAAQKAASPFVPGFWDHLGWGFGLSITTEADDISPSPGRFGWDGGYGTTFAADPTSDRIAILLTQTLVGGPQGTITRERFLKLAFGSG